MFQEGSNVTHRIGIMGGDGIGPEVVAEGLKVIDALGIEYERIDYDLGGERYLKDGTVLSQEIIDEWRGIDALYAGAVGTPDVPPGLIERGLLLKMRFELDLYINYRPSSGRAPTTAGSATISSSSERTPKAPTPERAGCCGPTPRTRSPPRVRSTPAWVSSAASATPSTSR